MNRSNDTPRTRRRYSTPKVTRVKLDNEISMIMDTIPGDPEKESMRMESYDNNPFKIQKA